MVMVIVLIFSGVFQLMDAGVATTVCVIIYIVAFEFSSGPITWLYMAEIMGDKATGFASALNWFGTCLIGGIVPSAINSVTE